MLHPLFMVAEAMYVSGMTAQGILMTLTPLKELAKTLVSAAL
jgi:hypothetical protein